jgi:hypothetical protein
LTDDPNRRETVLAAWTTLMREGGATANLPAPELNPVTASVRSLPQGASQFLLLPKVGTGATMNEEETRESLRRFIAAEGRLLGADPQQLSLELRTDEADGTKKARYLQHPFRRPLRNGYGVLEISFTPDRRITQIYSTCIPDAERLRATVAGQRRTPPSAEDVAKRLAGRTFTYTDASGQARSVTLGAVSEISINEAVVYPRPRAGDPQTLELHLAWEISLGAGPTARIIYMDAVNDELLGVEEQTGQRKEAG